jgi:glycosyltransferase involved in cell wall biosynthesis
MKISLYAPLKSPFHSVPSGDRQVARNLMMTLRHVGFQVEVASDLRSYSPNPTTSCLRELRQAARAEADRIAAEWNRHGVPDLWFSYHPYYKSPDLIGADLTARYGLPHVTLEASYAKRREAGPYGDLQRGVAEYLRRARLNLCFTERDRAGLAGIVPAETLRMVAPFFDVAPFAATRRAPAGPDRPVALVTVAMMREGDKFSSYRMLSEALRALRDLSWTLDVIGAGPAEAAVRALFDDFDPARVRFRGQVAPETVPAHLAGADVYVWPGCGEAFGLAYLEAQAAGLPVVAQATGGIPAVVRPGETGVLTPEADTAAFAAALRRLLGDATLRRRLGDAARARVVAEHSIEAAAASLGPLLTEAIRLPVPT